MPSLKLSRKNSKRVLKRKNSKKSLKNKKSKGSNKKKMSHADALKSKVSVYCMKCRSKQHMHKDGRTIKKNKNGSHMLRGVCQKCATVVVRII